MGCETIDLKALQPSRARGLSDLRERLGDVTAEIDARLRRRDRVRVLEVGFGFGTALMELAGRYGDRLELHGINRTPAHGDWSTIQANALDMGVLTTRDLARLTPPTLHFADVSQEIPLPDDSVDLAFSQVSWIYFDDKIEFFQHLNRVLTPDGVARIDCWLDRGDVASEYATMLEIWDEGRRIPFWEYIKPFVSLSAGQGKKRPYLQLRKSPALAFNLELVQVFNLNEICSTWWGKKSIYRVCRP